MSILVPSSSSKTSRRAVAPQHYQDYEDFANDPDPFALHAEMANIRTLQVELRASIETMGAEARQNFYRDLALSVAKFIHEDPRLETTFSQEADPFEAKKVYIRDMVRELMPTVKGVFEANFGAHNTISQSQAKTMGYLVETGAKIAEKQRKMLEMAKTQVKWDETLISTLLMFVTQCVIPNVSNIQERAAIAAATKLWLPKR